MFLAAPTEELAKIVLNLSKDELRTIVGVITGHIDLNSYLKRIGRRDDPLCDRCSLGEETAQHFFCECPAWASHRRDLYGSEQLNPTEVLTAEISKVNAFIKRTGRLALRRDRSAFAHPHRDNRQDNNYTPINGVQDNLPAVRVNMD